MVVPDAALFYGFLVREQLAKLRLGGHQLPYFRHVIGDVRGRGGFRFHFLVCYVSKVFSLYTSSIHILRGFVVPFVNSIHLVYLVLFRLCRLLCLLNSLSL